MKTNARSMQHARSLGWLVWRVERRLPKTFTTVDLFGCFDSVALVPGERRTVGIQSCGVDVGVHLRKLTEDEEVMPLHRAWLQAGNESQLWAWRKLKFRKKDGSWSSAVRWKCRRFVFEDAPGGVYYEEIAG